jgi:photosystem II stability/assembly factor-like uncharacterized protein
MKKNIVIGFSILLIAVLTIIRLNIYDIEKKLPKKLSGAYEALKFWNNSRAYPNKDIDNEKFYIAFQDKKFSKFKNDTTTWMPIGPHNVPGRMISLAVNPQNSNTLYAGAATGGLWRTYNSITGSNWHRIETGYPTLGVMGLAINPSDSNEIYIGTGEVYGYNKSIGGTVIRTTRGSYGIGILKTTDGGQNWSKTLDWSHNQEKGVQCIRINPQNPNSVYAGTTDGIYKTTNSGTSWQLVLPVLMGEDIIIHPVDTTKIVVSCGNLGSPGSGIYRSLDGGNNWSQVSGIPAFSGKTLIDYFKAQPDTIFASVADSLNGRGLYRSYDFGSNWTLVNNQDVPSYQGFFAHFVALHPGDYTQLVWAGVQINKSHNSGTNLTQISSSQIHVDHHNFTRDPNNPDILFVACDGGVYRSINFGDSYTSIGYGLQTAQFYNGFSSSPIDSNLAMGGLQDNGTQIYRGTFDWDWVIGGDGCWTAINPINDDVLYGEYQYNNVRKSTNRGLTFSIATSGMTQGGAAFVAPFIISPSNPSILYSGRLSVFKTTNSAANWTMTGSQLDGNSILSLAVSPTNSDIVYAGTAPISNQAGIFRSLDGGNSWTNVTGNLPDRYPMDLAVDPHNEYTAYAIFSGFSSGHVYKSEDAGNTWQDITNGLPDVPTHAIAIDPWNSLHIYVGNDIGVYVSTDGGLTWQDFHNGLPEAVIAMDLNISLRNRKLRIATHGNGAYQKPLVYQPQTYLSFHLTNAPSTTLQFQELDFMASGTNYGYLVQSDSFDIEVRILDDLQNEVHSEEQSICCLMPNETREIVFNNTFTPQLTGDYFLEFIELGSVSDPRYDTTRFSFSVIEAATITGITYQKIYSPYQEVTGTSLNLVGDDVQGSFNLPFNFEYDGFVYDKAQISTNCWFEFGTGTNGTLRGLSTSSQIGSIGANQNGRLASTERPNKALGPWWEDLNTDPTGVVGYTVEGTTPNRVLIIQWKDMRAYWDPNTTTTRVNLQVRLFETTNVIEYHYGPVVQGTFAGGDIGAMIGVKDHLGGDYHYYDIYAGKSGLIGDITTDLSPLTDWPGPDSAYVINTITSIDIKDDEQIPFVFDLKQNYPNPFNPRTTIKFSIPKSGIVTLKIYNTLGQLVETIINDKFKPGEYHYNWNAGNYASGVYYYKITLNNSKENVLTKSRKLILLK